MVNNLFIFIISLFLVTKGATMATKYAARLAENFRISKYTTGFIVIAIISILPETFISINSALNDIPSFGLATLFGSNIADLTLVFTIIILTNNRGLKIESKVLKDRSIYQFLLLLPIILGLDGYFSRLEGLALIIAGIVFYYVIFKNGLNKTIIQTGDGKKYGNLLMLTLSMILLLAGSNFTVSSATALASALGIDPILIGMLIVGLGTTMPELFFSLKSIRKNDDSLAVGDILGTVLADATIVVGILALVSPFSFPIKIIYITGAFMIIASIVLFQFMRSGRILSKREATMLLVFWIIFTLIEFIANK